MSTALFSIIGIGSIVAFLIASLVTSSVTSEPPPMIIVQAAPLRRGMGCLPFLAGVVVTLVVLMMLAGA